MQKYKIYNSITFLLKFTIWLISITRIQAQQTLQLFGTYDGSINSTTSYVTFIYNPSAISDKTGGLSKVFAMAKRQATRATTTIASKLPGSTSSLTSGKTNQPTQPPMIGMPRKIYISVSICRVPRESADYMPRVFVATDPSQSLPKPNTVNMQEIFLKNGFANYTITIPYTYIGILYPNKTGLTGDYYYSIGASILGYRHPLPTSDIHLIREDTDSTSALFRLNQYFDMGVITAYIAEKSFVTRLSHSACAFNMSTSTNLIIKYDYTTRGSTDPSNAINVSTVFISKLNNGTDYIASIVTNNSNTLQLSSNTLSLKTLSQINCRLISDLSFCDKVAYSVPANPSLNTTEIANIYDDLANTSYQNFSLALAQYSCDTAKYSLVRNCDDCRVAYKNWICAVSIPRCGTTDSNIIQRQENQSRIPAIDGALNPGAYGEIPPCINLCYNVTQSCPPILQFTCPPNGTLNSLLSQSYGMVPPGFNISNGIPCNPMGGDWVISMAIRKDDRSLRYWTLGLAYIIFGFILFGSIN
ncbi:stretch-activated Ca2+-permeable channel component-domain-containing protein [Gigaspora margarita]|uniref:Stretch-activated Ca2+-permeable channel component-domain-containing protein n=1 Tax=Gigaspora margarita TaxID=4874 RepID=A0A8H3ZW91_GIGMA|nr:stretch-activated Ca2+-permeable channel component-domain-containing protein [Gigaspora margarita]